MSRVYFADASTYETCCVLIYQEQSWALSIWESKSSTSMDSSRTLRFGFNASCMRIGSFWSETIYILCANIRWTPTGQATKTKSVFRMRYVTKEVYTCASAFICWSINKECVLHPKSRIQAHPASPSGPTVCISYHTPFRKHKHAMCKII